MNFCFLGSVKCFMTSHLMCCKTHPALPRQSFNRLFTQWNRYCADALWTLISLLLC
jgi:hypothetical protein